MRLSALIAPSLAIALSAGTALAADCGPIDLKNGLWYIRVCPGKPIGVQLSEFKAANPNVMITGMAASVGVGHTNGLYVNTEPRSPIMHPD